MAGGGAKANANAPDDDDKPQDPKIIVATLNFMMVVAEVVKNWNGWRYRRQ